jgi:hypothetical protein
VKDDYLTFLESQFEPESMFEFDLGMALGTLLDMIDHPEEWAADEQEYLLCVASDLIEKFVGKYEKWMEEYVKREKNQ